VVMARRYLAISGTKQEAEFLEQSRKVLASRVEHTCTAFGRLNYPFMLEY
jgi:hypothetical protein